MQLYPELMVEEEGKICNAQRCYRAQIALEEEPVPALKSRGESGNRVKQKPSKVKPDLGSLPYLAIYLN